MPARASSWDGSSYLESTLQDRFLPAPDYMETVQTSINAPMRSILVDWLIEVQQEKRLSQQVSSNPWISKLQYSVNEIQALFLSVNYIDRVLSGLNVHRTKLQLLGCEFEFVPFRANVMLQHHLPPRGKQI